MTFDSLEASGGTPLEAYLFQVGHTAWRYTSADADVVIDEEMYTALPIARGGIVLTQNAAKTSLEIKIARNHPLMVVFVAGSVGGVMSFTLFRGHRTLEDWYTVWKGRVITWGFDGSEAKLQCESIFTSMKRPGLRLQWQYMCNALLYDERCGVDRGGYAASGQISVITGLNLTIPGLSAYDTGHFVAGYLRAGLFSRMITGHNGDVIQIDRPIVGLTVGNSVMVYAGCNHTMDHCANKFDSVSSTGPGNLDNYRGYPWIPLANPFSGLGNSLL